LFFAPSQKYLQVI